MNHADTALSHTSRPNARCRAERLLPRDPWTLLTGPDVEQLLGISRVTLYRWVASGSFPAPDKLLPGRPPRKAWLRSTVEAWLRSDH